ncbi:MAG TPA: DUF6494 family protein [Gemmatimonadales bacterium]|jgi:hypothetical protein
MNDDAFNLSVRRFLKQFGVSAQRQIERAVAEALESGKLSGKETLRATAQLRLEGLDVDTTIEGEITLG